MSSILSTLDLEHVEALELTRSSKTPHLAVIFVDRTGPHIRSYANRQHNAVARMSGCS